MTLSPTPDNNGPERAAPQRISSDELLRSAIELRQQGYGVVPVGGERGKDALASGFHGYSAGDAALDEIRFWPIQFGQRWTHNAVRCPVGVLGIDVDNYVSRGKDKRGLATIAEYEQRLCAELPATYITTAREGGSGIRWYRIPGDYQGPGVLTTDDQLPDGVEPGVELIARHLRYGVVRGIHSETGEPYRLHGPDGALAAGGLLPTPAELPELPSEWVEGLAALCPTRALVGRLFNRDEIDLWLDAHTGNEYPHGLAQVVKRFHSLVDTGEKDRHKAMFACLCWALKESYVGGYPAREAEQRLRAEWLAKIAGDPNHDEREFDNMLRRAIDAAEGDDHGARWARMVRDYATDTRDYAGLVDGVRFHTELRVNGFESGAEFAATTERNVPLDLAALRTQPRQGVSWIEPGMLPVGSYITVVARGGVGKSILARDIAVSASQGKSALDSEFLAEPKRVIYLDNENGDDWWIDGLNEMDAPLELPNLKVLTYPSIGALDTPAGARDFHALIEKTAREHLDGQVDVVVLDTISRFIEGDEDRANTWNQVYRLAIQPLMSQKVAVVRLDHLGKDANKGGRGSSSKDTDVDAEFIVTADRAGGNDLLIELRKRRRQHFSETLNVRRLDGPLRHEIERAAGQFVLRDSNGNAKIADPQVRALVDDLAAKGVDINLSMSA
ncbi:AAA family ATPase [Mycolicibacterium mageritense]|uniref:AAA family ATPase n=1 Tax=Mycolicibacterium mageritense TaxID=53462 RepID=UPI001E34C10E|nr:AAA family ATPase [Mycolicibacterium mageritense]MCC9187012.1 AAA family ATPase [Mycolicibacterium mageritense]